MESQSSSILLKSLGLLAVTLVLALFVIGAHHFRFFTDALQNVAAWRGHPWAVPAYIFLSIPYLAVGLPRQAACLTAGLVFGSFDGVLVAMVATLAASALSFSWARYLGDGVRRLTLWKRVPFKMALLEKAMRMSPFQTILMLRLLPVGSALLITHLAGFYQIRWRSFLWATLFGAFPQNLIFVLIGSGLRLGHEVKFLIGIGLFLVSSVIGVMLLRRIKPRFGLSS